MLAAGPAWSQGPSIDVDALRPVGNVVKVESDRSGVTLRCDDSTEARITALTPDIVRVRAALGRALPTRDHSWARSGLVGASVPLMVTERGDGLTLSTGALEVQVRRRPLCISVYDRQGHLLDGDVRPMGYDKSGNVAAFRPFRFDEHFYGLGEKAAHLDHRRAAFTMWNYDRPGYGEGDDPIYQSVPFYLAVDHGTKPSVAHGVFFDSSWRGRFDFATVQNEHVMFAAQGGEMDVYTIAGPSPADVVRRYTELTGRLAMPPKWALGHQQCRYSYYPQQIVEKMVDHYRAHDLPLDVAYLDIHYMDGYRVFTFDATRFPSPRALTDSLHAKGVKLVTIIDPGVKFEPGGGYRVFDEGLQRGLFVKRRSGELMVGKVWPGLSVLVDYTREDARRWWGDLHKVLVDAGVDGIWNDMNEPADFIDGSGEKYMDGVFDDGPYVKNRNVFALLMGRATYEGLQRLRPDRRPYVITRAGYAGIQRYATMWTGDNVASWDSLSLTIPMLLNVGISGEAFAGADIGGFMRRGSGELLARWYQVAFLAPFCRNHKTCDAYDQEPWRFGQPYEDIIRRYLKLRYRFLPYLYACLDEAHRTGLPIMRPLFMADPDDAGLASVDDCFMVGDGVLVAPVLLPGQTSRRVYLPRGTWYDWWSGARIEGGQSVTVAAPLETVPMFAQGGAMVPLGPAMNHVDEKPTTCIDVEVFADASGAATGRLYDDDGVSPACDKGVSRTVRMRAARDGSGYKITVEPARGPYRIAPRILHFRVHAEGRLLEAECPDDGNAHVVTAPPHQAALSARPR